MKYFLRFLIISLLGAGIYYLVFMTDIFEVEDVILRGQIDLEREDIIYSGNIEIGRNIFLQPPGSIKKNLSSNPYIESAIVKRSFPNKFLVDIVERREFASIPYMNNYVIINEKGVVLAVRENIEADIPILTGVNIETLKLGDVIDFGDEYLKRRIFELLTACKNQNTFGNISEINIYNDGEIKLYTIVGIEVVLGEGEDLDYKMKFLNKILIDLYNKNIRTGVIDMSHGGSPVYRER